MLDCRENHALSHDRGRVTAMRDVFDAGGNFEIIEIRADENVARVRRGRSELQIDRHAGVQSDTAGFDWFCQSVLSIHYFQGREAKLNR